MKSQTSNKRCLKIFVFNELLSFLHRNRTVSIGQETILRCGVKGYPRPSLEWFFEGVSISNESENYMISGSGDLTILKVTADMEGQFQCKATNQEGVKDTYASLKVVSTTTIGKFFQRQV